MTDGFAAGVYDLKIEQGATYERRFRLWQDVAKTTPFILTDCTVAAEIRRSANDSRVLARPVCEVESPATAGWIHFLISKEASRAIPAPGANYAETSFYCWDMEITNTVTGKVIRVLNGIVEISPEATKDELTP